MPNKKTPRTGGYESYLWETPCESVKPASLRSLAESVCKQYPLPHGADCHVEFYPYTSLKSTVRMDQGTARIRLSDVLQDAPEPVLEALIHVLVSRACRKKPKPEMVRRYHDYVMRPDVEQRHATIRSTRTKKILSHPAGRFHDLNQSFDRVNLAYFNGAILKPTLTWSLKRSRRQLGYHDEHLNLIALSRWLDRAAVPQHVVDFIMYHEMLHIVIPAEYKNGRRHVHTAAFRQKEKQFLEYDLASRWLRGK